MKRTEIDETSQFRTSLRLTKEESWATAFEEAGGREARRMKHCKFFFRIVTEYVNVPEHLQLSYPASGRSTRRFDDLQQSGTFPLAATSNTIPLTPAAASRSHIVGRVEIVVVFVSRSVCVLEAQYNPFILA
jgi:hypothetical protein